ncbi:hypothetical protein [Aggregatimonas sangjinii]|nr:hypothetical protein [Aggregatimonas sangjinii]
MIDLKEIDSLAYEFYPKNVSSIEERHKYHESIEYNFLIKSLDEKNSIYDLNKLKSVFSTVETTFNVKIENYTLSSWLDRCHNWQFLLNENADTPRKIVMCLNISKIIPAYLVYILEVEFDEKIGRLKYSPRRNELLETKVYKQVISEIEDIISSLLTISRFPMHILSTKIMDLSFQDIKIGEFTYLNAFFLNSYNTRFV